MRRLLAALGIGVVLSLGAIPASAAPVNHCPLWANPVVNHARPVMCLANEHK